MSVARETGQGNGHAKKTFEGRAAKVENYRKTISCDKLSIAVKPKKLREVK